MMEVRIEHLGEVQFEIKARRHTLVSDQPLENGGLDEGMTPPNFFSPRWDRVLHTMPPSICANINWPTLEPGCS